MDGKEHGRRSENQLLLNCFCIKKSTPVRFQMVQKVENMACFRLVLRAAVVWPVSTVLARAATL